jgi:hypothetical protein
VQKGGLGNNGEFVRRSATHTHTHADRHICMCACLRPSICRWVLREEVNICMGLSLISCGICMYVLCRVLEEAGSHGGLEALRLMGGGMEGESGVRGEVSNR